MNTEKIDFYINDLNFSGDKKINNYILNNLKKYQNPKENIKNYNINILSNYEKTIENKNASGNPTSYNIKVKTNITVISNEGDEKVVSCDTTEEFMNVLQFVRDNVSDDVLSYVNPL